MKKLLLAVLLLTGLNTFAQNNDKVYDWNTHDNYARQKYGPNDDVTYRGRISFDALKDLGEFSWVRDGADDYTPNEARIAYLQKHMEPYQITVFMGIWDDNSHILIPALYKVLDDANYWGDFTMYSVNRALATEDNTSAQYHISQVPVIILTRENREIGRITGKVSYSVEDDLAAMIQRDEEDHLYKQ